MGKANKRRLRGLQRRQRQRRGIQLRKRISQPKITTTVAGYCEEKGGRSVGPTNALVFQQRFSRQRQVSILQTNAIANSDMEHHI